MMGRRRIKASPSVRGAGKPMVTCHADGIIEVNLLEQGFMRPLQGPQNISESAILVEVSRGKCSSWPISAGSSSFPDIPR